MRWTPRNGLETGLFKVGVWKIGNAEGNHAALPDYWCDAPAFAVVCCANLSKGIALASAL
jgi:hypothetical protein